MASMNAPPRASANGGSSRNNGPSSGTMSSLEQLMGLSAPDLKAEIRLMQAQGGDFDSRVSGTKIELASRLLAGMRAVYSGDGYEFKEKLASLVESKSKKKEGAATKKRRQASAEGSSSASAPRRPLKLPRPRPYKPRPYSYTSTTNVSSNTQKGWPLYVDTKRLGRAADQDMYLVARPSWEQFVVIGNSGTPYTINLNYCDSSGPTCSCPDHQQRSTVCKHILFTLMKVLNLGYEAFVGGLGRDVVERAVKSTTAHLSYADALMRIQLEAAAARHSHQQQHQVPGIVNHPVRAEVEQRELADNECCGICCTDFCDQGLKKGDPRLVFCRSSCGKSLHASCFQKMVQYNASYRKPLLCVYCRHPWA